ncbi:MAG: nucleotide exchange factor GrpE [Phycisphaerae bacterium]|nr:nucleotide exchange factor GrpE [Phycisphaerae bacterium]
MSDETKKRSNEQESQNPSVPPPVETGEGHAQEIDPLRKEKDELFAKFQRICADYANFQKRVPKQISDSVNYEKERLLKSLLPVLDNFERTLKAEATGQSVETFIKGVEIIRSQMLGILKSHGVEPIPAVGEKFDPERHEAMLRKHDPDRADEVVLEEYQTGYRIEDRILRPSRVAVNKIPQEMNKPSCDQGTEATQDDSEQEGNGE